MEAAIAAEPEAISTESAPQLHPALKANLWVKGQSGNPKGAVKQKGTLGYELRKILDRPKVQKELAAAMVTLATRGNSTAINQLLDRELGPVIRKSLSLSATVPTDPQDDSALRAVLADMVAKGELSLSPPTTTPQGTQPVTDAEFQEVGEDSVSSGTE